MKPLRRGDQYFTGGNIDLYPLELARHLASEIVMTFNSGMVDFELLAINVTLGYNMAIIFLVSILPAIRAARGPAPVARSWKPHKVRR